MDATHPIWRTPAVQEAAAAGQFGGLIRMTRTAQRLSLVQAGQLVGYSASTLSRIETGQRKLADVTQLRRFAEALGIPAHLFGLTSLTAMSPVGAAPLPSPPAPTTVNGISREGGDDPVRRRELLAGLVSVTGTALLGVAARPPGAHAAPLTRHLQPLLINERSPVLPPVGVQVLRSQLADAHAMFRGCRYHELAGILPDVIVTAQASLDEATGQRHDQTAALLADAYSLASNLCTRLHDDALAWVTAERARSAAQASGTVLDLGAGSGKPAPELLATYGSLLCTAAYTAAQNGSRHHALDLITEAELAATRMGDAQVQHTPFSSTNATIYRIGVHTALGDAGTALDYARKINLRSVPTPERQARFCLDTARAWDRFGSPSNCFKALQTAERCAPEELRRSSVRSLIASLLDAPGPTPSGLRDLAARCGALA